MRHTIFSHPSIGSIAAILLLVSLSGCAGIWNAFNRDTLQSDITSLFMKYGAPITTPECHMLELSRDALCLINAYPNQVDLFSQGAGLTDIAKDSTLNRWVRSLEETPSGQQGCTKAEGFQNTASLRVLAAQQNPASLKLPNGSAFNYLVLYQNPATNMICVQLSYASTP